MQKLHLWIPAISFLHFLFLYFIPLPLTCCFFPLLHVKENTRNLHYAVLPHLVPFYLLLATGVFISSQLSFTKINPINYVFPCSHIISQAGKKRQVTPMPLAHYVTISYNLIFVCVFLFFCSQLLPKRKLWHSRIWKPFFNHKLEKHKYPRHFTYSTDPTKNSLTYHFIFVIFKTLSSYMHLISMKGKFWFSLGPQFIRKAKIIVNFNLRSPMIKYYSNLDRTLIPKLNLR